MVGRGSVTLTMPGIPFPLTIPFPQVGTLIAQALSSLDLPLAIPIDLAATDQIETGGTVDYAGGLTFDLGTSLEDAMVGVREALAAAGYPELAATFEVGTTVERLTIPFPHPTGTTGTGTPTATGDGVTAAHDGDDLVVEVDEFVVDTGTGVDPIDAAVTWSVVDGGTPPPATLDQTLGTVTFGLDVGISGTLPGALFADFAPEDLQPFIPEQVPLTAGASGAWACVPADPAPVLATTAVVGPCASGFVDVSPDHLFCPEIAWAAGAGLVNGWPDGTYRPVLPISRQHFAAMLYRQNGEPPVAGDAPTFTDVGPDHLFADAIRWLADEGITTGYDDGTFRPTAPISRQGIAAMFHRAAGEPPTADDAPTFTDVGPDHLFADAIRWLADEGITTGYDDGAFRPTLAVSRQVIAAFFQRQAT
jgi:hypothetical protein